MQQGAQSLVFGWKHLNGQTDLRMRHVVMCFTDVIVVLWPTATGRQQCESELTSETREGRLLLSADDRRLMFLSVKDTCQCF